MDYSIMFDNDDKEFISECVADSIMMEKNGDMSFSQELNEHMKNAKRFSRLASKAAKKLNVKDCESAAKYAIGELQGARTLIARNKEEYENTPTCGGYIVSGLVAILAGLAALNTVKEAKKAKASGGSRDPWNYDGDLNGNFVDTVESYDEYDYGDEYDEYEEGAFDSAKARLNSLVNGAKAAPGAFVKGAKAAPGAFVKGAKAAPGVLKAAPGALKNAWTADDAKTHRNKAIGFGVVSFAATAYAAANVIKTIRNSNAHQDASQAIAAINSQIDVLKTLVKDCKANAKKSSVKESTEYAVNTLAEAYMNNEIDFDDYMEAVNSIE